MCLTVIFESKIKSAMKRYKLKLTVIIVAIICISNFSFAQKIIINKGSISDVKAEKNFNIEYDYSTFGVGKFDTEAEYIASKKAEYEEKEAGRGEKFEKSWHDAKTQRFEPKFEELVNKYTIDKAGIQIGEFPESKYTLIVRPTFIEPGFNVGVMKRPAFVNFEYLFVETSNHDNVIVKMTQKKVPGSQAMGYDYDSGSRIAESFAKGGKELGKMMIK